MKKIKLGRNGDQGFAKVDDADYPALNEYIWTRQAIGKNFYAVRFEYSPTGKNKLIRMHREILGEKAGPCTDHIDGDGLNNQRENLRVCVKGQNSYNRKKSKKNASKYKGVFPYHGKNGTTWRALIGHNGKIEHLGMFDTEEAAAHAYDLMAKKYFGEFARLNLP